MRCELPASVGPSRKRAVFGLSVRAGDAEVDDVLHGGALAALREDRQRIARDAPVGARALERCLDRLVLLHESDGVLEIAIADVALDDGPVPELAVAVVAATEGKDDRQRDLTLAEIVAH